MTIKSIVVIKQIPLNIAGCVINDLVAELSFHKLGVIVKSKSLTQVNKTYLIPFSNIISIEVVE